MPDDYDDMDDDQYWDDDLDDIFLDFQDPGGESALRRATVDNPRNLPCGICKQENRLTSKDVELGYQCDACANSDENPGC